MLIVCINEFGPWLPAVPAINIETSKNDLEAIITFSFLVKAIIKCRITCSFLNQKNLFKSKETKQWTQPEIWW
ncbi:hypothetical protein AQUCO_01700308v1 [Aquilegia coerulea]|uniref:Uncharacterized protein n=1 Tax=Aquilegia coerulea TaxID=218851 RepID=A0A2G5DM90_AQUCA|nr:hypothetical protein AQUCO_01700308v1 [Aquilegia coerulea]